MPSNIKNFKLKFRICREDTAKFLLRWQNGTEVFLFLQPCTNFKIMSTPKGMKMYVSNPRDRSQITLAHWVS